jgi:hypothetical protein
MDHQQANAIAQSLASPSRTASHHGLKAAFGKSGIGVINQQQQQQHEGQIGNKIGNKIGAQFAGVINPAKNNAIMSTSKPLSQQSQQQQQHELVQQQRQLQQAQFNYQLKLNESKKLQNVYRFEIRSNKNNNMSQNSVGIPPLTPVLQKKVTNAQNVVKNISAPTPRVPRKDQGVEVVDDQPGSDVEHDDIIPHSQIPDWAQLNNVCAMQEAQSLVDADSIFLQPRKNWCKLEQMFHSTLYNPRNLINGQPRRRVRPRSASAIWDNDKLHDHEIKAFNKALGIYTDNY